jgi:hypothetical protein
MTLDNVNVTIENFNKIMKKKINILLDLSVFNKLNLQNNINTVFHRYILLIGDTLREYSINYENKEKSLEFTERFYKILDNNNILNILDIIYKNINNFLTYENKLDIEHNKILLLDYKNNYIYNDNTYNTKIEKCTCVNSSKLNINENEIICSICGSIYNKPILKNHNVDDINTIKYDFLRHYRIWLEKILGINDKYLNKYKDEYNKIKNYIEREYPLISERKKISINLLRQFLKKLNITKLNDLISILMIKICNIQIPTLNAKELTDMENLFINIIKVYDIIKDKKEINRKYYPYFIYKIIEYYFRENKEKLVILKFIHLQKKKTLAQNDTVFKSIADKIPHLITFKVTINTNY